MAQKRMSEVHHGRIHLPSRLRRDAFPRRYNRVTRDEEATYRFVKTNVGAVVFWVEALVKPGPMHK